MNDTQDIKRLEKIKNKLQTKEEEISKSQIKQNKLENQLKKLETKKKNIFNGKRNILITFFSYIIYDLIMISVLMLFITNFLGKLSLINILYKTIYIIEIYIGVTIISISGAILSNKIEEYIRRKTNPKIMSKILKQIESKEKEVKIEATKQDVLKQDITKIINSLDGVSLKPSTKENLINNSKNEISLGKHADTVIINSKKRIRMHKRQN